MAHERAPSGPPRPGPEAPSLPTRAGLGRKKQKTNKPVITDQMKTLRKAAAAASRKTGSRMVPALRTLSFPRCNATSILSASVKMERCVNSRKRGKDEKCCVWWEGRNCRNPSGHLLNQDGDSEKGGGRKKEGGRLIDRAAANY